MKTTRFSLFSAWLLLILLHPSPVTCRSCTNLKPFAFKATPRAASFHAASSSRVTSAALPIALRGGEEESSSSSLEVASKVLVYLFGGVNAFHGIILAFVPTLGEKLLATSGADDPDAAYAEESIGAFALEYGITGYLAVMGGIEPEKAIAYGTLPDLLFMSKNLLNGKFKEMGVQNLLGGVTLVVAASTATILADKLHVGPVLEVLTIVPALQGIMKYVNPVGAANRMMGTDLSDKPVAKALYRHSGQMKIVSAVLRGAIAFGVKPLSALGYSVFANAILIADSLFIRKSADDIGKKRAFYHQVGTLVLALAMGTVFVLQGAKEED